MELEVGKNYKLKKDIFLLKDRNGQGKTNQWIAHKNTIFLVLDKKVESKIETCYEIFLHDMRMFTFVNSYLDKNIEEIFEFVI